jgi:MinD-like ATPase involved in chromosome partitioning or flagellar assembly
VANQDKDRLAGTEESARDQPGPAAGPGSAPDARVPGGDDMHRGSGAKDSGGSAAADGGSAGQPDNGAAVGPRAGENGAPGEDGGASQAPSGLHRPAGFAAGYPQSEQGYAGGETEDGGGGSAWMSNEQSGGQPSPYPPYGDYPGYPGYPEQGYPGYAGQQGYGQDQGYGDEQGYPPEGYGAGYPQEYGEGYGQGGPYGEGYSQGYGQDQPYGEGYGQGYPEGPAYGGPSGEGQPYGQDQGYGPARGYPGPPRPESELVSGQHHSPGADQRRDPAQTVMDAEDQGGGHPSGHVQAPAREAGQPGPYPPQDSYRWQPGYEGQQGGPPQAPGPYAPYGTQAPGRDEADEAPGPYRGEGAYPQVRTAQDYRGPGPAEALTPLPAHTGEQQQVLETADDLTAEALLHGKRQAPATGWRRALYKGSGGLIHPRESAEAVRRRELIARVRTPVAGGHHRVAVMSLKGGVGKTTTCVGLGAMLASLRGDRIIALDANPDRGTLSDKVKLETAATVRDLLNERDQIQRYADVRAFTSQAPSRLEVLASDRDPAVSIAFSEEDYYDAARVLEHFYSISLTDCGTGLLHSAMAGVLRIADQIVLVSSPSVDGARSASATLDWLDAHEYGDLVRNAVVVLSMIRPRSKSSVDLDRLENHFAGRCRAVVRIPYDPHLEEGAEVDIEQMSPATVNAYLTLAATVGDGFAWPRRGSHQPGLGLRYPQLGQPSGKRYGWSAPGGSA